jgi:hypothetical protein
MSIFFTFIGMKENSIEMIRHALCSLGRMLSKKTLNGFRLLVIILIMGASACSSKDDSNYNQRGTSPEGKHDVYNGPLSVAFRSVQESLYLEACDKKQSNIQKKLITALDLKSKEILKTALDQKNHSEDFIPFSKSFLVNTPKKPSRKGWQDEPYSWNLIYEYYTKNLNKNKPWFWTTVDAYVRSLITDDRKRVVYGYNLSLNHEQVEKLHSLKETAEACNTDTRCLQPRWSDDQLKVISEVPAYSYFQNLILKARSFRDQRKFILKMFERIQDDFNFHRVEFNSMVNHRKTEGKHFYTLPMDASNFSSQDRETLEKSITSVWKNDLNTVSIEWKKSTPSMNLFRFLFELEPNNRSFVNFALREIHLFPYTAVRTVAHEFGHVLGFDDHYYTIWDPEKCEYRAQYNEEDIMSGSETGDVTEQEWQTLFEQYGNR